jgi:hypothetical protein
MVMFNVYELLYDYLLIQGFLCDSLLRYVICLVLFMFSISSIYVLYLLQVLPLLSIKHMKLL